MFWLYWDSISLFQGLRRKPASQGLYREHPKPFYYAFLDSSLFFFFFLFFFIVSLVIEESLIRSMNDWAAPLIATALFAVLSPGILFQMPGKEFPFQFMSMKTNFASMFVHAVIYGLLLILFLVILDIHLYVWARNLPQSSCRTSWKLVCENEYVKPVPVRTKVLLHALYPCVFLFLQNLLVL